MKADTFTAFRVQRSGPLALLQDAGRFGVRHLGVTQGGPADLHAWAWANRLAGNNWGTPVLEVTFGGLELLAEKDLTMAVTGGDLVAKRDGMPMPCWRTSSIKKGEKLTFGTLRNGLRAYLAVAGGFWSDPVLGSVACVGREKLGGFDGQGNAVKKGDLLTVKVSDARDSEPGTTSIEQPDYSAITVLDLLPGAQIASFTGRSLFDAFNADWIVDDRADRMGVRLTGPQLRCNIDSLISEGISLGSVQVPPDGQPIALLNDRQTIGGYPKLGNLTPLAASRLAQCPPGHVVKLRAIGIDAATTEHRQFLSLFN
jgi:biotin-dependent carboxylase-like uncharacterized protein